MKSTSNIFKTFTFFLCLGFLTFSMNAMDKKELLRRLAQGESIKDVRILITFVEPPEPEVPNCGLGDVIGYARVLYANLEEKGAKVALYLDSLERKNGEKVYWAWLENKKKFFSTVSHIPMVNNLNEKGFIVVDCCELLESIKDLDAYKCEYKYLDKDTKGYEEVEIVKELLENEETILVVFNRMTRYYPQWRGHKKFGYLNEKSIDTENFTQMLEQKPEDITIYNITSDDQDIVCKLWKKPQELWSGYKPMSGFVKDAIFMEAIKHVYSVDTAIANLAAGLRVKANILLNKNRNHRFEKSFLKNNPDINLFIEKEDDWGFVKKEVVKSWKKLVEDN